MRCLRAAFCLSLISAAVFAQSNLGTITGTITDPTGAVVQNAPIEAKNLATGAVYPAAASATGNYTISQLPLGTYELSVNVPGFKRYVRSGITVEAYGIYRIDPALQVGTAAESVVVNAEASMLKTESTEQSYDVPTQSLDDLPILTLSGAPPGFGNPSGLGNIRNPLASLQLMPGTDFATDNTLRVNGMPSSSQSINVEGQDDSNGFWKQLTQVNQVGTDAIQEVTVQTSNYAAEYGQAGGGYINYTMKSGTNDVHGSAFDYITNTVLNAGLPFTIDAVNPNYNIRNPIHQNDFGGTIGGPVVIPKIYNGHDKTFFFVSFEQFRQTNFTTNGFSQVPNAAERAGNFAADEAAFLGCNTVNLGGGQSTSACPNQIFDPTTRHLVNGIPVESPFPNNTIPKSMLDPTALIIQKLFPMPNNPSPVFNYTIPGYSDYRHTTIPSIKIDELISSKIKLSGYYSATLTYSPQNNGFEGPLLPLSTSTVQDAFSQTVRLNLDDTLTPTLLLHFGAGLLRTTNPSVTPAYNQSGLFPEGAPFPANYFPYLSGLDTNAFLFGGFSGGGGFPTGNTASFFEAPFEEDIKPTFNASATWIHGNHTFKLGATALFEGIPSILAGRANGEFEFSNIETANPAQYGQPWANTASSGMGYASFLMGMADGLQLAPSQTGVRLGMHSYALYLQDSWKVTRALTLELGLRWDYANLWTEEHGRLQNADFTAPNPLLGGRLGTVEYGATCNCTFAQPYPFSIGPHIGVAYQITPKTVFRAGGAINYGSAPDQAGLNASVADFLALTPPGYGLPAAILRNGDPYAPGNVYGNPVLTYNTFYNPATPQYPPVSASGVVPPSSPFVSIASNAARLPRIFQWSIGFQQEITKDTIVEASYVGNRGAWWTAPLLSQLNYNGVSVPTLQSKYGINIQNPADQQLLLTPISSPNVTARFPYLANPNSVYPGFPSSEPLIAALVPYPQWYGGVPPFLGPPDGDTWYDSLQVKLTKRYSHGLTAQVAYTYQKELTNGVNSNTSYLTPDAPLINNVFDPALDKQLSGFDIPQELIIAFTYATPTWQAGFKGAHALSWATRDWTLSGLLRYQSGLLIRTPPSNNNLLTELGIGPANNPALWGGGTTFYNRVPNQPLFLVNPNSHFDPTKQLVLNPNAWTDAAPGTYGASAPYYNDFRWQRQPAESLGFGRIFRLNERVSFQIRAEFQNIFNRLFYSMPADGVGIFGLPSTNPATPTSHGGSITGANGLVNQQGLLSAGYGFVAFQGGAGAEPRSGQIIGRITF